MVFVQQHRGAYLDELLRVQRTVPVLALPDGSGDLDACSVDRLPDVFLVDPPCDLRDKERGQPLGTARLVHAQEVYFAHLHNALTCTHLHGDTRDEPGKDFSCMSIG